MAVAVIWSSLGTSRPQRQVLYNASKGVNSSVGLVLFQFATYRNHLISVGGHKKIHRATKNSEPFSFFGLP